MKTNEGKAGDLGLKLAFTSKAVFVNIMAALLRFITLYATDGLGLPAAAVGTMFMVAQGVAIATNLLAGVLIERTHTRLGQARPYDLAVIGYGLSILLMFHVPAGSEMMRMAYLFIMYTLTVAVFGSLIVCNEAPYLSNAIPDTKKSLSIVSFSSAVSMIFAVGAAVAVPQLIAHFGTTQEGWFRVALILVLPSTAVGMIKFLFVKERRATQDAAAQERTAADPAVKRNGKASAGQKSGAKEGFAIALKNRYVIMFALIMLVSNLCYTIGNTSYYCVYILGNIGFESVISISAIAAIVTIALMPKLSKKIGTIRVLQILAAIGLAGSLLKLVAPTSLPVVFLSCVLMVIGNYPALFVVNSVVVDLMDYSEKTYGNRAQGAISSVVNTAAKIGAALGMGLQGVLLSVAGYKGTLAVQSDSARFMILALASIIPAVFFGLIMVFCHFGNMKPILEKIRGEQTEQKKHAQHYNLSELHLLGHGECAEIFELDDATVLKLAKEGWGREDLYEEYRSGKVISASSIPAPKVYDFVEQDGRYGFTMEKLKNYSLIDYILQHPTRLAKAGRIMAEIHAEVHSAPVPEGLVPMADRYREFILNKPSIPEDQKQIILAELQRLIQGSRLCVCHGDFHPVNVLLDGEKHTVIDWILATCGDPMADVAGSWLVARVFPAQWGGSNPVLKKICDIAGRILADAYLKRYLQLTGRKREEVMQWIPVVAAKYVDVGLTEETNRHFLQIVEEYCKKQNIRKIDQKRRIFLSA